MQNQIMESEKGSAYLGNNAVERTKRTGVIPIAYS